MTVCNHCGGTGEEPVDGEPVGDVRDREATKAATQEGMSVAEKYANVVWKAMVRHAIHRLALTQPYLTSDDVRIWMTTHHPEIETHNKSALGPLLVSSAKRGWIESVTTMRSEIPVTHGKHITIWGSRIYADLPN